MPKLPPDRAPKLRYHRGVNQFCVSFPGETTRYLGTDQDQARDEYANLVARWFARGRTPEPKVQADPTLREIAEAYQVHALGYYRKRGEPTTQAELCVRVADRVILLCGDRTSTEFGVTDYKLIRDSWVRDGLSRGTVNQYASVVKRFLAWAVEEGKIPITAWQAAWAVRSLPKGRSPAPDLDPVEPIPSDVVEATCGHLSRRLAGMIQVMSLTGMRPGELVVMRGVSINVYRSPWIYCPERHKTEHLGHVRSILVGPRAQAILSPFLAVTHPDDYLLTARDFLKPMAVRTLRKNIQVAAEKAGVPPWHPNQLRHAAGTRFRAAAGLEASRVSLGHRNASTTEIYAARDLGRAAEIIQEIG